VSAVRRCLGVDIGTSSVKLFLSGDRPRLVRAGYARPGAEGVVEAIARGLRELGDQVPLGAIDAIGLSGQTGTYYLVDDAGDVAHQVDWHAAGREEALARVLADIPQADFLRMTGMRHPRLASYPLPTMAYLRGLGLPRGRLMQPKDYVVFRMAGEALSDAGSWRGLANPESRDFDGELLAYAGWSRADLPRIAAHARVDAAGARLFGLREGAELAVGMNDFYAALYGMGVASPGDCFDVTGTSEHLGVVVPSIVDSPLIVSPYLGRCVHYGVTASGGLALSWAQRAFGPGRPDTVPAHAPLFLPYLRGERAPVFDSAARGMFVGLTADTGAAALHYAVLEGVAFSICQVYDVLGRPPAARVRATGGPSADPLLNRLKASLLNAPIVAFEPNCGSALGAAAAAGGEWPSTERVFEPEAALRPRLLERYALYARMYGAWRDIAADADTGALFGGG